MIRVFMVSSMTGMMFVITFLFQACSPYSSKTDAASTKTIKSSSGSAILGERFNTPAFTESNSTNGGGTTAGNPKPTTSVNVVLDPSATNVSFPSLHLCIAETYFVAEAKPEDLAVSRKGALSDNLIGDIPSPGSDIDSKLDEMDATLDEMDATIDGINNDTDRIIDDANANTDGILDDIDKKIDEILKNALSLSVSSNIFINSNEQEIASISVETAEIYNLAVLRLLPNCSGQGAPAASLSNSHGDFVVSNEAFLMFDHVGKTGVLDPKVENVDLDMTSLYSELENVASNQEFLKVLIAFRGQWAVR